MIIQNESDLIVFFTVNKGKENKQISSKSRALATSGLLKSEKQIGAVSTSMSSSSSYNHIFNSNSVLGTNFQVETRKSCARGVGEGDANMPQYNVQRSLSSLENAAS
ncbi:hypothetical protein J1N35_029984 [Gossypium stocksii]|uniref:Uncharacterized protein n=1 Tax=Gossypium stocksii TaxID=47602 RepID=A0A9D3UYT2_9ROSI|nr:hypothetical protein J1N35_029984 [Gossypium stocksii]